MRILLLNPNHINRFNWGHQLFKNEIGRQHEVTYYGEGFSNFKQDLSIPKFIEKRKRKGFPNFDLIITYETKWIKDFKGIEDVDIPKAHIVIDYVKPRGNFKGFSVWPTVNSNLLKIKPDIIFARTIKDVEDLKRNLNFKNVFFLPFSVDTYKYKDIGLSRNIDVMASFTINKEVYPLRHEIQRIITRMPITSCTKRIVKQQYINKLNRSKIFINSGSVKKRLNMKFTESLSCGTFLLTEEAEDMDYIGLKNGEHLVTFKNLKDLKEKIKYYLNHEKKRKLIGRKGMKFVRANHSNIKRVKQMIDKIKEVVFK